MAYAFNPLARPFKPSVNESMAYAFNPLVRPGAPPLSKDASNTYLHGTKERKGKHSVGNFHVKQGNEDCELFDLLTFKIARVSDNTKKGSVTRLTSYLRHSLHLFRNVSKPFDPFLILNSPQGVRCI